MMHSYGIKALPTTVKNPAANAIVERLHLWMADVLRMKTFEGVNWKFEVDCTLQTIAWAFRTVISSTFPCNPVNLSFESEMIVRTKIKIDW